MGQFTRRAHRLFDIYLIILLSLAPILFGFSETPSTIIWILCAAHFVLTVLIRVIPFPVHGMIELCVALISPFVPGTFGFWHDQNAAHFFIGLGFGLFVLWLVTDYRMETRVWNKEAHLDLGVDVTSQHVH